MSNFIQPIKSIDFLLRPETSAVPSTGNIPFENILKDAINGTKELTAITEQDNANMLLGDVDNLAQIQINSLKAKTMLQTTVQLTSRVVNAYKEIMQMQI